MASKFDGLSITISNDYVNGNLMLVVPFGSTSPELTGPGVPGNKRHRLLKSDAPCSPCFRRECPIDFRCMNGISVETALKAVLAVLAEIPPEEERHDG